MKDETLKHLNDLYKQQMKVVKATRKLFKQCGGDVNTLDDPEMPFDPDESGNCPPNYIKNSEGKCIEDPGVGK